MWQAGFLCGALMVAQVSLPAGPSGPAPLDRIVAAERAFAAATRHLGIRDGFLTFLTADAIDIAPERDGLAIVSLPARLRAQPAGAVPPTRQLLWEPRTGAVSQAGDLGWLTGPYRSTARDGATGESYGAYFSIWKRQADGTYKVRLDIGIATASPVSSFAEGFTPAEPPSAPPSGGEPATERDIRAVEAAFADAATTGVGDAYRARLLPGARLHRNERSPFVGAAAAAGFISGFDRIAWAVLHAEVADSGDLAFTAGSYDGVVAGTEGQPQSMERGFFVRVWQRDAAGVWRIAFETNGIR
jgi:ketosteroid isomerase-like protein